MGSRGASDIQSPHRRTKDDAHHVIHVPNLVQVQIFKLKHESTCMKYPFLNSPVPKQNTRDREGWEGEEEIDFSI